jgi:anthranilate/para-aminobenzoate synthase component I
MQITTFDEFKELAQRGTFVPVYKEIVADMLTPVSAFLKIAEHSDYAFLLESVEGGEQIARYSFLGKDPFLILRSRAGKTIIERCRHSAVLRWRRCASCPLFLLSVTASPGPGPRRRARCRSQAAGADLAGFPGPPRFD